ncbi:cytochrome d ubiquinol oxidase subunit II [Polymorphobacter sp.]|uniref:cytochrome d ubiquinol oxidase subunit II n=1 Tax=Polymorphobacter sp. TaxID=1909290 RepID=UPI003F72203F
MLPMIFDYETMRLIWWLLIGVLLIGFALTDGFDLGVGTVLPFIARTDEERRLVINSIGATWEGNQVWFILGGGAIFAAWPYVYAISFSGFYLAMFLVLAALILRPVAFKYRSKRPDPKWRSRWDWALFVGGFVPALVFGVALGNVLTGVPFALDSDLRSTWSGSLLDLFSPFALIAGLLSVSMLVLHGAGWLSLKIEHGPVLDRAKRWGTGAAIASILLFALAGAFVAWGDFGFRLTGTVVTDGPSNPLLTRAEAASGAWLDNYSMHPWMLIAPLLGFLGPLIALFGIRRRADVPVFVGSSLAVIGTISTVGLSMFPFILPSSMMPAASLTVWNASSSHLTLWIMLIVVAIFLPLVLLYTAWVFRVLFGRVTTAEVRSSSDFY